MRSWFFTRQETLTFVAHRNVDIEEINCLNVTPATTGQILPQMEFDQTFQLDNL